MDNDQQYDHPPDPSDLEPHAKSASPYFAAGHAEPHSAAWNISIILLVLIAIGAVAVAGFIIYGAMD